LHVVPLLVLLLVVAVFLIESFELPARESVRARNYALRRTINGIEIPAAQRAVTRIAAP
jgi:hypothetical protein